jgi:hypothetical protein
MASSHPGQAASLLFYFSVLLVTACSVTFGLDWMSAPLPPMPETEASVQAAKLAAHVLPPRAVTVVAKAAPRSVYPAQSAAPQTPNAGSATAKDAATAGPNIIAPEQTSAQTPDANAQPKCDVAACAAAYHSFRASDCTWQPYDGPRRICDKGHPPQTEAAATPDGAPVSDKCDVEACRRAYFTFNPADCTYQPSNGPRRLCEKGTPPKPTLANTPAAAPAQGTQVSNKCDIEACKQAYFTFNPADCTYQPSDGPRRLCTKGTPPKPEAALPPAPPPAAVAPPPSAAPPPAASPSAPPASTMPPASNAEPAKQEAPVPPAATPPSPALTAPADTATPPTPASPAAAAPAPASDKCDVEACKRAYFTFNPADCTYQPSNGPRRLCSKGTPPKPQAVAPAAAPDHPVPPGLVPARR